MLKKAVKLLRGSVCVRAKSAYPERMLNLCSARGIEFWDVRWIDDTAPCRRGLRGGGIYRAHGGHAVFLRAPAPTPRAVRRCHSVCGAAARQLAFHLGF